MKLIHLTDLHIVAPGEALFTLDPAERLRRVIERINLDHSDAELCVITGDLTDKGLPAAYGLLRELLQELRVPYRLLVGNHDDRQNFVQAFPEQDRDERGFIQSVYDCAEGRLIFLDTLVQSHGYGALTDGRLEWLSARLAETPQPAAFLFAHHPLQSIGMPHFEPYDLLDRVAVANVLAASSQIRHIFCGHVHVDVSGSWLDVPFSASRGVAHQIVPDLVSRDAVFIKDAPAFDVALIQNGNVLLHRFRLGEREIIGGWPKNPVLEPVQ
ncbi:3',5'-cyclic AMP phosphodiesterase CpdA [Mesorhizobium robiniae]|uniref:3',5'-cyclic AMP phosphodiesterase CpdA n=1 Tax=Mesorhizobium robiniae TaxID=559315 RepID=A0ABV2GTI4_9HYPH